jgi:hypothetical protein
MSTESSLWLRLRDAVGSTGHWERREFNPIDGVPDVSFCVEGVEGHMELKQIDTVPAREDTAVFGGRTNKGMRESQVAWFHRRMKAGGRAFILAQVSDRLILMHGSHAKQFNGYTLNDFRRLARYYHIGNMRWQNWQAFLRHLSQ